VKKPAGHLTYANVISTLCLFLLLGGGAAIAASNLGKNSVGPKQLKKNAVTTAKIKKAAVTTAKLKDAAVTTEKLADGAVNGAKVADGSLTGTDINQATLTSVRASNVTSLAISADDTCSPLLPLPAGVTSERPSVGNCRINFPTSLASCTTQATVHLRLAPNDILIEGDRDVYVATVSDAPNTLRVSTLFKGGKAEFPVDLLVVC
jgi:hypothetical protein